MSKVFKIGITPFNNKAIKEVDSIDVMANKGIVGDRYFKEFNDSRNQLSLIESENIDYFNVTVKNKFKYKDFRRNIITSGIDLNKTINKIFITLTLLLCLKYNNKQQICKDIFFRQQKSML